MRDIQAETRHGLFINGESVTSLDATQPVANGKLFSEAAWKGVVREDGTRPSRLGRQAEAPLLPVGEGGSGRNFLLEQ